MHVEGPQICQINRRNNSFQNMYDMLYVKVDHLAGKTFPPPKKNTKKRLSHQTSYKMTKGTSLDTYSPFLTYLKSCLICNSIVHQIWHHVLSPPVGGPRWVRGILMQMLLIIVHQIMIIAPNKTSPPKSDNMPPIINNHPQ